MEGKSFSLGGRWVVEQKAAWRASWKSETRPQKALQGSINGASMPRGSLLYTYAGRGVYSPLLSGWVQGTGSVSAEIWLGMPPSNVEIRIWEGGEE